MRLHLQGLGAVALSLALTLAACGDDTGNELLGVNNVSPVGSVGGIVIDAATMNPMSGVKVTIVAGGKIYPATGTTAQTDSDGIFAVKDVPAGSLLITFKPGGTHQGLTLRATLANAAGDFPLANATLSVGPIGLIPLATTAAKGFKVTLVTEDGAPAPSIKAYLRSPFSYVDYSNGNPSPRGTHVVEATSNNQGKVTFTKMPDFNKLAGMVGSGGLSDVVRVSIPPYDSNSDGAMDFLGKEMVYNVIQLKGHIPTIVLNNAAPTSLKIEAASIAALMGKKGVRQLPSKNGPMYVAFNWPISNTLTKIALYDEQGKRLTNAPTISVSGNLLAVNFVGFSEGAEYNISIRAVAKLGASLLEGTFGAPFFTPPLTGSTVTANLSKDANSPTRVNVKFSEPVGTGKPGQSLSGGNSVLFFGYDINGSGKTGDMASERGNAKSNVALMIDEKDPPGPASTSGFSSKWYFEIPKDSVLQNPIPGGTPMDMAFSNSSLVMQRASGEQLKDMYNLTIPN